MRIARTLGAAAAAMMTVLAVWTGCDRGASPAVRDPGVPEDGGPDHKDADAHSTISDQKSQEPDQTPDRAGDAAQGSRPCRWPGWFVMPRMPANYESPCIPDDAAARVPHLTWTTNDTWCKGCKLLDTPWVDPDIDPDYAETVWGQVRGVDAVPSLVAFGLAYPTGIGKIDSDVYAVFDSEGTPRHARRSDGNLSSDMSGKFDFFGVSTDGMVAGYYLDEGFHGDHHTLLVPVGEMGSLYWSIESSVTWPKEMNAGKLSNGLSFSSTTVASDLMGSIAIGKVSAAETFLVTNVPGAPPGELSRSQVVGDTVFFGRYDMVKSDRWVYHNNKVSVFLTDPERDYRELVTDGAYLIWTEGSQPVLDENNGKHFSRYDLFASPYTTDPAKIQRRLLMANCPPSFGNLVLQNGFAVGGYFTNLERTKYGVAVVRLSDGAAWRALLAPDRSWHKRTPFPSADGLWGIASRTVAAGKSTIVRFPYASMEVIQTGFPDGGI